MKINKLLSTLIILIIIPIISQNACKQGSIPVQWKTYSDDSKWVQSINKYLSLSYYEEKDKAAFFNLSTRQISPSLYTTFNIVRMLKSIGAPIENTDLIINSIDSLRSQDGSYLDTMTNSHRSSETDEAITIITELGGQPQDIESTVNYLLSLEYDDGTFLVSKQGITLWDTTLLQRITNGSGTVINSLKMLGQAEKIPQETIEVIEKELSDRLGGNGTFPIITDNDTLDLIGAIKLLASIDPALVTDRAREFIIFSLSDVISISDAYFVSTATNLLDIAQLLNMPEAEDDDILEKLRKYMKQQIFPQQNLSGGFGPSNTVEPLTTSMIVMLSNRIGVEYPNFDQLMEEIDKHWVDNGWTPFIIPSMNTTSYEFTYYSIEIASFSEYRYNNGKITELFDECLLNIPPNESNSITIKDIYFSVLGLKALNGQLTDVENQNAKDLCLKLARNLSVQSDSDVDTQYFYILPISKLIGFEIPDEIREKINKFAGTYKEMMLIGERAMIPQHLYLLWNSLEEHNSIITLDEVLNLLGDLYDPESGSYTAPAILEIPTNPEQTVTYAPHPEIFQTYLAIKLLMEIDEPMQDEEKTLTFVNRCKQNYGFSRAPDWPEPNLEATYAALMILKQLSE